MLRDVNGDRPTKKYRDDFDDDANDMEVFFSPAKAKGEFARTLLFFFGAHIEK